MIWSSIFVKINSVALQVQLDYPLGALIAKKQTSTISLSLEIVPILMFCGKKFKEVLHFLRISEANMMDGKVIISN